MSPTGRILLVFAALAFAQSRPILAQNASNVGPLRHAHAHNDYRHQHPLDDALEHGFSSVEADVYLVDGELLVAHARSELRPDRTLTRLYLDPLRKRVQASGRLWPDGTTLTLLVDVKDDAEKTYQALARLLSDYDDILSTVREGRLETKAVTVVVSGNRARETIAAEATRRVGIDGRLSDLDSDLPSHLIPLISDNWLLHFRWRGEGLFPDEERARLPPGTLLGHAREQAAVA